jgi:hypothetical protein
MKKELDQYHLPDSSVQEQWNHFEDTLKSLMKKFIPRKVPRSQKHKPWINRDIITVINRRNRAHLAWKKSNSQEKLEHYRN